MKKTLTGTIVSTKMSKTVIVRIEDRFKHPVYQKIIKRHKKYKAHNESLKLSEGDQVKIQESRPISKDKHFVVVEKI